MSNIGQGSNESTLDQEAALNKKQKKSVSQGVKGSVAAQAGMVSPESAIAVKNCVANRWPMTLCPVTTWATAVQ